MDTRGAILARAEALAGFPGQKVPPASAETLDRAEKIAGGTVFFYQRTPVEVGLANVDWSGAHIKHQEWPAQLNRFSYLGPLASAYRETGEERFARAARAYVEDWISGGSPERPEGPGRPWPGRSWYETEDELRPGDNTLNISIRLGTSVHSGWGGVLPAFLPSPAFDDAFLEAVLDSLAAQADFLSRHLSPWGNWRISQLDALVFTALRFPFLRNAQELLDAGVKGMRDALATQFLPDGVHIERTPGYASWMSRVAANYLALSGLFPEADAGVDPGTVVRALDYSVQSRLFGVNDALAPWTDPERPAGLDERNALLGKLGLAPTTGPPPPKLSQVFPDAGQVFMRSSWEPGADHVAFDAGTWGGGHCHLSRLSLVFRSGGRALVADPGILDYEMTNPLASYGKSTRAHSTLNVNGCNQSDSDAALLRTEFGDRTALVHAQYQGGYWEGEFHWSFRDGRGRGVFGNHERVLFWVKGEYVLVLDALEAERDNEIRNCWQMGPMDAWHAAPEDFTWWSENGAASSGHPPRAGKTRACPPGGGVPTDRDSNLLLRLVFPPEGTEMECFEGSKEPIRGWVGLHGNDSIPAPQVEFRYPAGAGDCGVSAVLLAAFAGAQRPTYEVRAKSSHNGHHVHYLELAVPGGWTDRVGWSRKLASPVDTGALRTDAVFAWYRTDRSGDPVECFLLDGGYLEHDGRSVFESRERSTGLFSFGSRS